MLHGVFMKKKSFFVSVSSIILLISILGVFAVGIIYLYVNNNIDFSVDESLFLSSKSGNITTFYYDDSYGRGEYTPKQLCTVEPSENKKVWYSYEDIGDNVKLAFISAEDRRFFKHNGIDIKRTGFALVNYFLHLKPKFGGSTITQQVIKNISGDNEQTATRKITEIIRAIHIEHSHTKEEIFEVYLNIVPMGEGISGVGLAAQYYFGKDPKDLSYAEAATLVGITNAPVKYNPHTNLTACKEKRNNVLYAMLDAGHIDEISYKSAINSELCVLDRQEEDNSINSWFVETVCDDICKDLAREKGIAESVARLLILNGGLSVYTTVNPVIQGSLEKYFENENNFPYDIKSGLNYSMVITDSRNGNLLGIIGSVGKKQGNRLLNYATVSHTPGSTLKPIALYAPLLNMGKINWATVFDDVPVEFNKNSTGEYLLYPHNYPDKYDGLTTVSDALRVSKNTVAVRMYKLLGKEKIFGSLRDDFGFDTLVETKTDKNGRKITDMATAPLALGQLTYGVSLRKLTEAYTVFPNDGELSRGRSYLAVLDTNGDVLLENLPQSKKIFGQNCARIMNQLLMRVTESGTAKLITLGNMVDTAGKTGTSGNDRDRLFIGYTPYYTAGIWCGYTGCDRSIGAQSISHLEIWDEVMKEIHEITISCEENPENFSTDGLLYLPYCKDSGGIYTEVCEKDVRGNRLEYGYFSINNKPSGECHRHVYAMYDELSGGIAVSGCPHEYLKIISLIDVPERSFPCEIIITDAEYVWRKVGLSDKLGDSYDVPFFIYTIPDGEYVGRSKGKKQYNSSCYIHND